MEDLIRKSEVMNRLKLLRYETEMNHRAPNTRRVMRLGCIDVVIELVEEISEFQQVMIHAEKEELEKLEALNDQENQKLEIKEIEVPKYPKNRILEPIMRGSAIGIDRFRCGKCGTNVRKEDRYCRSCGAMFGEIKDWNSTKWDTVKDCPADREVG